MTSQQQILTDELLERIRGRAATYDRENSFFADDLADLREAGYLTALVPTEYGGAGMTLPEVAAEQRRLAAAAPATALSVNMHHVWMGVARTLRSGGDSSADFVLAEAAAGELFGFGISEPGNDLVLFGSNSEARPDGAGGYSFHGTKIFTSMAPVWTRMGTFGTDHTSADGPQLVYAFLRREDGGVEVKDDWDTLGMRASQSCTTVLHGAHAPADRVVRRLAPGPTMDPFVFGIFANFELLLASVYVGIAQRALELAVAAAGRRTSTKREGAAYSQDPDTRWRLADAAIALDGVYPQVESLAADVERGADRGELWMPQLSAAKYRACETALRVTEQAVRVAGGSAYFSSAELSRLYRDVLAGIFHPTSEDSVHGAWANLLLGPVDEG